MKGDVRVVEEEGVRLLVVGGYVFGWRGDLLFPLVVGENEGLLRSLPYLTVDRGAIPKISSGAHVMRPGVVRFSGEFSKGDVVVVRDDVYERAIAVGLALEDSKTARELTRGKILENIHHVDDKFWRLAMKIK